MADDNLSPDTRKLIGDRIQATDQLMGDWEQDLGKEGGFKAFQPQDLGFGQHQNTAIQNVANQKFLDPAISQLQQMQKSEYAGNTQKQMQQTQGLGLGQLRYDNARQLAAHQRVSQEEAQRAALIGGIFGLAGVGVGAAVGGAPGAMAGGQAGSKVGGAQ